MADLAVNLDSMTGTIRSISEAVNTLEDHLKLMQESVSELNQTWEGPNHDEFVEKFGERYEMMVQLNKMLRKYLSSMKKAKKTYTSCEETVNNLVGRLI